MKKLLIICLLGIVHQASSQPITPETPAVKIDYLKISRAQKTAAWLMLGGGTILVIAGTSIALQDVYLFSSSSGGSHYATGSAMFYAGGIAMLGSIPLFIAGAKNKGRSMAATAQLKMEPLVSLRQQSFIKSSYPALSLKFNLK